jgi:large subunit ribosomal protein L10e
MAGLRKANAYSKRKVTPFTRVSKRRQKSYIKMVPSQKIVKFSMGKLNQYRKGKYPFELSVISVENVQLRHNAMEACRQYINKKIDKELAGNYLFKIVPYPHHVQRENKMLTGAGADRMQTGMQLAYGKSGGKAAILKEGSEIFYVALANEKAVQFVRGVFKQIKAKLPCKTKFVYEKK